MTLGGLIAKQPPQTAGYVESYQKLGLSDTLIEVVTLPKVQVTRSRGVNAHPG